MIRNPLFWRTECLFAAIVRVKYAPLAGAASGEDGKREGRAARRLTEIVLTRKEGVEQKPEPKKKSIIEKR